MCKNVFPYNNNPQNGKTNFYVVRSPPDGDCMYMCISNALDQRVSVKDLRRLVSRKQTKEMYNTYMDLYDMTNMELSSVDTCDDARGDTIDDIAQTLPEFCTLEHIKSFDQFRHFIQLCGSEVGADKCMWGDENALKICSDEFGFTFAIFNEKGSIIQKIKPTTPAISPAGQNMHERIVLLRLNGGSKGQEHYDLLKFNGDCILTIDKWEYLIKKTSG
jgi:hypothetical protein